MRDRDKTLHALFINKELELKTKKTIYKKITPGMPSVIEVLFLREVLSKTSAA